MSTKPRVIVHVITSLDVGGAERSLTNLVLGLDSQKFTNIVVSLKDLGFFGHILQIHGIKVVPLHIKFSWRTIFTLFKFWLEVRKLKPDIIQGWMYHANIFALIFGRVAGVKEVYWNIRCSTMDLSHYSFWTRLMYKLGAVCAWMPTGIINNSKESITEHLQSGYKNKNWLYIPNGFNTTNFTPNSSIYARFRTEHHLPNDAIIIGMVARFDPMKDHVTFLRAAGILAKQHDNVYFLCAGRNINIENASLRKEIDAAELHARIILLNQVDNVHEIYPALDYLTQTSIFGEGFPNVVAEAMACGVPCFVTAVGDSKTVIGECGYIIPKQDPQALAKIWLQVIQKAHKSEISANVVRQRVLDCFSMETYIEAYSGVYLK